MSTVADVIDLARLWATDELKTRFDDTAMLQMVRQAVIRVNHLFYRNDIALGISRYTFNTTAGQETYYMPTDFMATAEGLYRTDTRERLELVGTDDWERRSSPSEMTIYRIWEDQIYIGGTPNSSVAMSFYYFPQILTDEFYSDTEMPWSGKMDSPIARYVFMLSGNIDEMNVAFDANILSDMETLHLNTYSSGTPNVKNVKGWA